MPKKTKQTLEQKRERDRLQKKRKYAEIKNDPEKYAELKASGRQGMYRDFPQLKFVTWNYLEAGHGKGAPDGVGAVLKRTADQVVRFGGDVDSLETILACLEPRVKIEIRIVTKNDIEARSFPTALKAAKGTMMVHQALWSYGCSKITLRKLSCFLCGNKDIYSHGKHMGYYDVPPNEGVNTYEFQSFLDENTTPELIQNIHNTGFEIDYNNPSTNFEDKSSKVNTVSPKVTILSDINVTDWVNRKFSIKKENIAKMKSNKNTYQTDFEKFIMNDDEDDTKENKDENCEKEKEKRLSSFWSGTDDDDDDTNIF